LTAIAAAAELIRAKSFTIDGEAVVLGPDGLSRFEELSRGEAARPAILYVFDLIEHDGEDLCNLPFLDRKAALARLLRNTRAGILFNEHIAEDGLTVFTHACRLGAEGIVSKKVDSTYQSGPCRVWIKVRNPACIAVQREGSEIWNRRLRVPLVSGLTSNARTTLTDPANVPVSIGAANPLCRSIAKYEDTDGYEAANDRAKVITEANCRAAYLGWESLCQVARGQSREVPAK
jgi:ATP dependent DNA ligase domain